MRPTGLVNWSRAIQSESLWSRAIQPEALWSRAIQSKPFGAGQYSQKPFDTVPVADTAWCPTCIHPPLSLYE